VTLPAHPPLSSPIKSVKKCIKEKW
jgi:hypothetical protein